MMNNPNTLVSLPGAEGAGFEWMTMLWFAVSAYAMTLALIHFFVWARQSSMKVHLIFVFTALSSVAMLLVEVWMFRAATPEAFNKALLWYHVPAFFAVVSLLAFVRSYLRAGRLWLAWLITGIRLISLALNFSTGENLNYTGEVTLDRIRLLGENMTVATGAPNHFMIVGQASLLLLFAFIIDAAVSIWRRGDRRAALGASASLILLIFAGTLQPLVILWDIAQLPLMVGPFFVGVLTFMAFGLSGDIMDSLKFAEVIREKESQVRTSEERLDLAANAANIGLWSVEPETGAIWASERARRIYGVSRDEPVDVGLLESMIHPDDHLAFHQALLASFEQNALFNMEYRITRRDGATRWMLVRGRMVEASDEPDRKERRRLVGASVDITERKEAEKRLAELTGQLERTSRVTLLGELSGTIAHELNQPLAGILNTAQAAEIALARENLSEAECKEVLQDIISDTKRAASVIRNLRDLYNDHEVEMSAVSMHEVIASSRHLLNSEFVMRGVLSVYELGEDAQVRGNKLQLQQVIVNLLMNSLQAIARSPSRERKVSVHMRVDPLECRVMVEDSGDGIPVGKLAEIFSPMTASRSGGMGLGLTICNRIIALHGGAMVAENKPDGGARIGFVLPVTGNRS